MNKYITYTREIFASIVTSYKKKKKKIQKFFLPVRLYKFLKIYISFNKRALSTGYRFLRNCAVLVDLLLHNRD